MQTNTSHLAVNEIVMDVETYASLRRKLFKERPRKSRVSARKAFGRTLKGTSAQRHATWMKQHRSAHPGLSGGIRRLLPASLRKRGRYVPGGPHRNCGELGLSPKSILREQGRREWNDYQIERQTFFRF